MQALCDVARDLQLKNGGKDRQAWRKWGGVSRRLKETDVVEFEARACQCMYAIFQNDVIMSPVIVSAMNMRLDLQKSNEYPLSSHYRHVCVLLANKLRSA